MDGMKPLSGTYGTFQVRDLHLCLLRWMVGLFASCCLAAHAAAIAPTTPVQATYDVWGGEVLDLNKLYYDVDKFGFTKLGTASRTATFQGRHNYYVVAVRKTEFLFLDAAQSTSGTYYQGSLATGNTDSAGNALGAPDGRYMVLKGPGIGTATSTYGSYAIFYNPGHWTGLTLHVFSAPLAPAFTRQPESQTAGTGSTVQLSVATTGDTPMKYQWFKNGQTLANGGRISGATSSNLTFTGIQPADAGTFTVLASNSHGSASSEAALLDVATPPASFTLLDYYHPVADGNEWTYAAVDEGQPGEHVTRMEDVEWPTLAWTGRGSPRTYTTNLVRLSNTFRDPNSHHVFYSWIEHFGTRTQLSYWGNDDDGEIGRVDGGLSFPTSITLGQTVKVSRDYYEDGIYLGAVSVQFTVTSWGSVTVPAGRFEDCIKLRVIYSRNGNSSGYDEWWARGVGPVKKRHFPENGEEQLDLLSYQALSAPRITLHPRSTSAAEGTPVTFTVTAIGTAPLRYQWRKNGVNLPGQISATLHWPSMKLSDVGEYSVAVANDLGQLVSSNASLTLGAERLAPSLLITSPIDQQTTSGKTLTMTGTATDAGRGGSGILSVKVNGVRAQNDTASGSATAAWTRSVNLAPGWNNLAVVAVDGQTNAVTNLVRVLSDPQKPSITLTTPKAKQRLDTPVVVATGTALDNQGVTQVRYQVNQDDWKPATPVSPDWTRWTATLSLQPGANTFRAYSEDAVGNRSPTNTVAFTYVVSAPLNLVTNGQGTITPNLGGQRLEIGKSYTLAAAGKNGFTFADWTSNQLPTSTKPSIAFTMVPNLTLTARFIDTTKPTLTLATPTAKQRVNDVFWTARGTASDNAGVARVFVRLNNGNWTPANGTTAWTRELVLEPGANQLSAVAEDTAGNRSPTNTVAFTYVVSAPLNLVTNGQGSITPNLGGQRLEIGKSYTLAAAGKNGFTFADWTSNQLPTSTKPSIAFTMVSNLTLTARFIDTTKPTLTLAAPTAKQRVNDAFWTARGTASDNAGIARVLVRLNNGNWTPANGTTAWTRELVLEPGANQLSAVAEDTAGNRSPTNTVAFTYVVSAPLNLVTNGQGTITPNLGGQRLEIGKSYTLAAAGKNGFTFADWTSNQLPTSTKPSIAFTMVSNLTLTARFIDAQKPTLQVTSPANNARVNGGSVTVQGTAADNAGISEVLWSLNGGAWQPASGTTRWNVQITLDAGVNALRFHAMDTAGNRSITNSLSLMYPKDLVPTYWPMYGGDEKTYKGPIGEVTMSFSGGPSQFSMDLEMPEDSLTSYYAYSADRGQLLLTGGKQGWNRFNLEPPIVELTAELLLDGGSRSGPSVILIVGQEIPAKYTIKVSSAGTVKVPAGTFTNCKRIDLSLNAPGYGAVSAEAYVLAPRVGIIRVGVYQGDGSRFKFVGWQDLVSGWVNGRDVRTLAGAEAGLAVFAAPEIPEEPLSVSLQLTGHDPVTGRFEFVIDGPLRPESVAIEGSDDLITWSPLESGTGPDGRGVFTDPESIGRSHRFYRAVAR
jgi:hypothetical protein